MTNAITIGTAANLFFGYKPVWAPDGSSETPFFTPLLSPLKPQNSVNTVCDMSLWSGTPVITLHTSAQSLLSTIYEYNVLPASNDPQNIEVPSGQLALNDADSETAMAAASAFLGLNLSNAGHYMLVVYERCASVTTGDYTNGNKSQARQDVLTPEALAIVNALPPATAPVAGSPLYDSKLTLPDAQKYLSAMAQIGTHFVTKVLNGDKLVQVFSYPDAKFKYLQDQFDLAATRQPNGRMAVSGTLANSWEIYTSPLGHGGLGFVQFYGNLTTISRDEALVTAIAKGAWANGYVPEGTASIFAATRDYALLSALTAQTTYACELTPMANLMPNALVQGPWDRLVAGGLLQKFGNSVMIPLRRPLDYDWSQIFPQTTDSWASGIATPVIDIYQERVDLAQVKIMGAEIIGESYPMQSFSCFAQVLQATSQIGADPITIPSDNVTLVAQIIDTTQAAQTPVMSMSDAGLNTLTLSCQDMYGALIFQGDGTTPVNRKTALDGFLMETPPDVDPATKRYLVHINSVLTDPPSEATLIAHSQSVEFSVVAGEALLQSQGPNSSVVTGLEVAYLNWLAQIIPANTTDPVLANARVRALYLANSIADFGAGTVFVPYVTYDSYSKYVGDLVTQAQQISGQIASYQSQLMTTVASYKIMTSIDAVNDNVRSIGGVLTQYFKALSEGRGSMDQYYSSIIAQLDSQLQTTLKNIKELQGQLSSQQARISNLGSPPGIIQVFEQDYVQYEKDEVFKATMSIVTGIFSLGVAFAGIPGAAKEGVLDALEALQDVYEKLQSVMDVISQLSVIEDVTADIGKINDLGTSIQSAANAGTMQLPSQVDLAMIPNNVEAALANVPTNGSLQQDKANLIAATRNLVIIGSALLNAQAQASQLMVEIANNQRLKTINSQQQAKMSALTNSLNLSNPSRPPDLARIDLIGMTGQLQFQLKQVLSTLAKVLQNQNGALQFTYFGEPVPITSFSLNQLLAAISAQDASIINAIQNLNPPPQKVDQPIIVKVSSIPYKQLINGNFKRITVHPSDPALLNYVMVRIDRVVPRITGVKSTASGDVEIALDTQAYPFLDRDPERQSRTFTSTRRAFGPYVYDVKTGATKFGNNVGTFADKVTHITPFTDWNISLPAKSTNKDIAFDDLFVDIELEFHITAIYNDPIQSLRNMMRRTQLARKVEPFALFAAPSPDDDTLDLAAAPSSTPSLGYLEAQMYQNQAVLNGWDAAFSMLSDPVNAFLNQQFQSYLKTVNSSNGLMTINACYFGTPTPVGHGLWSSTVTMIEINLTNPLLQFVASSDQATVQQYIKSGSVTVGSVDVAGNSQTGQSPFIPSKTYLSSKPLPFTVDLTTNELVIAQGDVLGLGLGSIYLSTTGTLPAPLLPGTPAKYTNEYYISKWSSTAQETRIQLTTDSSGNNPVTLTDSGSGTQTLTLSVEWAAPAKVVTSKNPYVFANVQLATIQGIVEPPPNQGTKQDTLTVTLDFPSGSFVLRNIHVEPPNWDPAPNATQISDAIANYYAQNDIRFDIQTINTKNLASDVDLTPTKFVLHAMNTNAGNNVLQVLMATTGKVQNLHSLALSEPVAYNPLGPVSGTGSDDSKSSDYMISLMISSRLTFQHIFVDSFNNGSTNFVVEAIPPVNDFEAWSVEMSSGTVTAPVPFKDQYTVDGTPTHFRINANSNNLTWDITGLTFSRTQTDGIALDYSNVSSGGTQVNFQYQQYVTVTSRYGSHSYWTGWTDASAIAYVTMSGTYPLEVFNSGSNQSVKFSTTNPTVTVDKSSDLKPTGACECNDNDLKIALMDALSTSVPAQLQENMNQISFQPLSIMALESLLFPANQLISMSTAKVPCDSLIVGKFLAQVRQKSANYTVTIPASAGAQGTFGGVSFQNGTATNSATKSAMPAKFQFTYGPIDPSLGGQVTYQIDIEAGTISPTMIAVVYQPDATNNPQNVVLLLPSYPLPGS
ncbi:hypothetical protein H4S14_000365 [Agrobacterium vitis]|nr:hypothetical protein [Agrobacterium vitis]MBE1436638.1 hypothetical protein [Agrobacterium vitis]